MTVSEFPGDYFEHLLDPQISSFEMWKIVAFENSVLGSLCLPQYIQLSLFSREPELENKTQVEKENVILSEEL